MTSLQIKLIAVIALMGTLIGSHWYAYQSGGKNHTAALKVDYAQATKQADDAARKRERELSDQLKKAQDDAIRRQNLLLADARAARAESGRLHDTLADIRRKLPDLTESAVREYAGVTGELLDECQGKYIELAETADRLDNDRQTLIDAWPK